MEGFIKFKKKILNIAHSGRGFTIVEILLVLVLVSVMTSGVFSMFTYLVIINKKIEYRSNAYKILDSKMESYRNINFNTLVSESCAPNFGLPPGCNPIPGLPPGSNVTTTVSDQVDGYTQTGIKQVTINIEWEFKGLHTMKISSYVTQGGIQR